MYLRMLESTTEHRHDTIELVWKDGRWIVRIVVPGSLRGARGKALKFKDRIGMIRLARAPNPKIKRPLFGDIREMTPQDTPLVLPNVVSSFFNSRLSIFTWFLPQKLIIIYSLNIYLIQLKISPETWYKYHEKLNNTTLNN